MELGSKTLVIPVVKSVCRIYIKARITLWYLCLDTESEYTMKI
jgi:hypothetical protein